MFSVEVVSDTGKSVLRLYDNVVEAVSYAKMVSGSPYRQEYTFLVRRWTRHEDHYSPMDSKVEWSFTTNTQYVRPS